MTQELKQKKGKTYEHRSYHRTQMQKEIIIKNLKEQGYRITKQRLMILEIIMEEECSSCKEIYDKASRQDEKIGSATVYRMIRTLEEIGAISRKNMYKIACCRECEMENVCTIEFVDNSRLELSAKKWNQIIQTGLAACGYGNVHGVKSIVASPCECGE